MNIRLKREIDSNLNDMAKGMSYSDESLVMILILAMPTLIGISMLGDKSINAVSTTRYYAVLLGISIVFYLFVWFFTRETIKERIATGIASLVIFAAYVTAFVSGLVPCTLATTIVLLIMKIAALVGLGVLNQKIIG